jgi:ferritin-like metal-binding protein YciE
LQYRGNHGSERSFDRRIARPLFSRESTGEVPAETGQGIERPGTQALFTSHLEETKGQVLRLKQVFEILGKKPTGEHCNGMEGVIEEGADALEKEEGASLDSGIIGAALRTEQYEIAGYTAAIAMTKVLGARRRPRA